MTCNSNFMQFQADCFNKTIKVKEADTCWGIAKGALVGIGLEVI